MLTQPASEHDSSVYQLYEEFAKDQLIYIMPNDDLQEQLQDDTIQLIGKEYSNFLPNQPVNVPLWVGLLLYKRGLAEIVPPEWMSLEQLTETKEQEYQSDDFAKLPFYYSEISHLLITEAGSIFGTDLHEIVSKVRDIRAKRQEKLRTGLRDLSGSLQMRMPEGVSAQELLVIRPLFLGALQMFQKLEQNQIARTTQPSQFTESMQGTEDIYR